MTFPTVEKRGRNKEQAVPPMRLRLTAMAVMLISSWTLLQLLCDVAVSAVAAAEFLPSDHVFVQSGNKIQNSHGGGGFIGSGVAISADGKTLFTSNLKVVGDQSRTGMLVDTRDNLTDEFVLNTFVEAMANSAYGPDDYYYPTSIATSDDGSTVALLSSNASHEMVHLLKGTFWSQTSTFAFEKTGSVEMPPSIAISGNGQTVVFGSGSVPDEPFQPTCAQLFRWIGGVWNVTELPLEGVTTEIAIQQRRCQVDISANANTLLVGLPWIGEGMGGVLVYMRKRGNTYAQVSKLLPLEQANGVGDQLAVNREGNLAVVFSQTADMRRGGFWAFQQHPYIPEQWFPIAGMYTINDPTLLPIFIGTGLDGPLIAKMGSDETIGIGRSTYDSNKGAVWLFRRKEGTSAPVWEQVDQRLDPIGETDQVEFGSSLSFSQEGTLVVGARDYNNSGSIWVFRATPGGKAGPSTSPSQAPTIIEQNEASILISSSLAGLFGSLLLVTWLGAGIMYWHSRSSATGGATSNTITTVDQQSPDGKDQQRV